MIKKKVIKKNPVKQEPLRIVEVSNDYSIWNDIVSDANYANMENTLAFAFQANVNNTSDDEIEQILTDAFDKQYPGNESVEVTKIEGEERFPNLNLDDQENEDFPFDESRFRYFCVQITFYSSNVNLPNGK